MLGSFSRVEQSHMNISKTIYLQLSATARPTFAKFFQNQQFFTITFRSRTIKTLYLYFFLVYSKHNQVASPYRQRVAALNPPSVATRRPWSARNWKPAPQMMMTQSMWLPHRARPARARALPQQRAAIWNHLCPAPPPLCTTTTPITRRWLWTARVRCMVLNRLVSTESHFVCFYGNFMNFRRIYNKNNSNKLSYKWQLLYQLLWYILTHK